MPTHDSQWLSRRTRLFCGAGDDGRLQPSGDEVVPTYRVVYARGREITR